jgi:hypothetical protein
MWIEITGCKTVTQQEARVICCQCICVCGGEGASEGMLLFCKDRGAVQRYGLLRRKVKFGKNNLLECRYYYYYYYYYYYDDVWLRCADFRRVLFRIFDITSACN